MHSSRQVIHAILASLVVILCICALVIYATTFYFGHSAYSYQDAEVREALAGEIDTLLCGASHGCQGMVPAVLDEALEVSSYNISSSMMTMGGRYTLLKKEVERNPVQTVYLEVSYNALTRDRLSEGPEGDLYLLGRLDNVQERISFAAEHFYVSEYQDVLLDLLDRTKYAWSLTAQDGPASPEQWETHGFIPLEAENQTISETELTALYHSLSLETTPTADNIAYLEKIMSLCQSHDIRVVFVVTPVSDRFILQCTNLDEVMAQYQQFADAYGCAYYDFNLIRNRAENYPQDTAFYDISHLSETGAYTFSGQLAQVENMVSAGEDISDLFYGSYAEAEAAIASRLQDH